MQENNKKMTESEKSVKTARVLGIGIIALIVISVATWLICQFAVGNEKLGFPAFLLLFTIFFLGLGCMNFAIAIKQKKALLYSTGMFYFVIGLVFLLIICKVIWWVIIVIAIALLAIGLALSFIVRAPQLSIKFDNSPESGRKTYHEKKAEAEAEAKAEAESKQEEQN